MNTPLIKFLTQKTPLKLSIYFLAVCFCLVYASHTFFLRGLALDGVHILYKMITKNSFHFLETARITFHFLQQLPTWLFIKFFPSNSLYLLSAIFSFGLIYLHILSLIGCYLILPKNKKDFIFFPLLAFFIGPSTGFGASISASLSVYSWLWFVTFTFYYSNLSLIKHKILFLSSPLLLFLSHEMMLYMSWWLIATLYILKFNKTNKADKFLTKSLIPFLIFISALSFYFLLYPEKSELPNRKGFFTSLLKLEFFLKIKEGQIEWVYPPCIIAFLLTSAVLLQQFIKKHFKKILIFISILTFVLGVILIITPFYEFMPVFKLTEEEEARVWVACIALPAGLFIWLLAERKKLKLKKEIFILVNFAVLLLMIWRIGSDYQFYKFQKQFAKQLTYCKGIITWEEAVKNNNLPQSRLFQLFNWDWKLMSSSLIYPLQSNIQTVVKSQNRFTGCYETPSYGMCENSIILKNNKFFNFDSIIIYEKNNQSGCI